MRQPTQVFILGPTCTGKTELAILASERFGGEIISADSIQIYQGLGVGCAKPSPKQLSRAVHHLIDAVPVGQTITAADFRRRALQIMEERARQGVAVFYIAGGSGFYVQALQRGMFDLGPVPQEIRSKLRHELKTRSLAALYEELKKVDPEYATRISANDPYRVLRGLEIWRHLGRKLSAIESDFRAQASPALPQIKIGLYLDRQVLRNRVRERVRKMMAEGFIDEVRELRSQNLASWPPMASVGYKQVQCYLDGSLGLDELEERIEIATMQLAKRQLTWFRRDPEIQWFDAGNGLELALNALAEQISS